MIKTTVSDLLAYVRITLERDVKLQQILVSGEVSNLVKHKSGHWYFSLKEKNAKVSCVFFASNIARNPMDFKDGDLVNVEGKVSVYENNGNIQFYVSKVTLSGIGDIYLRLEELKNRLTKEGLFDPIHKKAKPLYPFSIGIIAGKESAALQDILITLKKRWPVAKLVVYPSLVQGIGAIDQICQSLEKADQANHDAIILARGGGSIEDLWAFHDEAVVRKIYGMKTFIITGVGHETDITLSDLVADLRGATPTAAAQLITPVYEEVVEKLHKYQTDLIYALKQKQNEKQMQLDYMITQFHALPQSILERKQLKSQRIIHAFNQEKQTFVHKSKLKIHDLENQMISTINQTIVQKRNILHNYIELLDAYSPLKIMKRGYSLIYVDHVLVNETTSLKIDQDIQIQLSKGNMIAKIKEIHHE